MAHSSSYMKVAQYKTYKQPGSQVCSIRMISSCRDYHNRQDLNQMAPHPIMGGKGHFARKARSCLRFGGSPKVKQVKDQSKASRVHVT